MLKLAFCVIAGVLFIGVIHAQDKAVVKTRTDLAERRLKNVQIEKQSLGQLFAALSFRYNIPTGLEIARSGNHLDLYRIDFREGKLSQLLKQFVCENPEYAWKIEDGVLSIFPKDDYRDPLVREILSTKISSFSVSERTSTWNFRENLLSTPESETVLRLYGTSPGSGYLGGFYIPQLGRKFSFDVSDLPVKSILDKVVRESPVARYWSILNDAPERRLYLQVSATLEDPEPDVPQKAP